MTNCTRIARPLVAASILLTLSWQAAPAAPVSVCDALTMYGWGSVPVGNPPVRVCLTLSQPTKDGQWVCGLTAAGAFPDVHTTFNASTSLHMTVNSNANPPACENNSDRRYLAGTYPGHLAFAVPPPPGNMICGVNVAPHLMALNGITGAGCKAGFVAAGEAQTLTQQQVTFYVQKCKDAGCP